MFRQQRIAISPSQISNHQIHLTREQYHYLIRVLRLTDGDEVIAIDGVGNWWLANLKGENANITQQLTVDTELPATIILLTALPKGNGFDDIVRICTELGVAKIVPILSDRTLLNPSSQKQERWQRIAQEAAEQSERAYIPTIYQPVDFATGLNLFPSTHQYICEGRGNYPHLLTKISPVNDLPHPTIIIATGPEGGWSDKELELAIASNFQPVSLGKRILRAISAPIAAVSMVTGYWESCGN